MILGNYGRARVFQIFKGCRRLKCGANKCVEQQQLFSSQSLDVFPPDFCCVLHGYTSSCGTCPFEPYLHVWLEGRGTSTACLDESDRVTLGLDASAPESAAEDVKQAFRHRALELHPDMMPRGASPEKRAAQEEQFKALLASYQRLLSRVSPCRSR